MKNSYRVWDKNKKKWWRGMLGFWDFSTDSFVFGFPRKDYVVTKYIGKKDAAKIHIYQGDIVNYDGATFLVWEDEKRSIFTNVSVRFDSEKITVEPGKEEIDFKKSLKIGNIFEHVKLLR